MNFFSSFLVLNGGVGGNFEFYLSLKWEINPYNKEIR